MSGAAPYTWDDVKLLIPMIVPERLERMETVLAHRTRHLTLVMEDLHDPHNTAAVLRSCDAFGVQDVHVLAGVQSKGRFIPSRKVSGGARRWLSVHAWPQAEDCLDALQAQGHRIAVTSLQDAVPIDDVDFTQSTAVVLGNEHMGVSNTVRERADVVFQVPMVGFVESLNLSVAAALILQHAWRSRERTLPGGHGDLSDGDRQSLLARWIVEEVRDGEAVLAELVRRRDAENPPS